MLLLLLLLQPKASPRPPQRCQPEEPTECPSTTRESGGDIRIFGESIPDGGRIPQLQPGAGLVPGVWAADISLSRECDGAC